MKPLYFLPVAALLASCTDVNLCEEPCMDIVPPPPDSTVSVRGEVCTVDPGFVLFPYKILFIIDVSGSNAWTDPADNRAAAVQRAIDANIENRAVSFGVIAFTTTATALTQGFTRDYATLVPSVIDYLAQDIEGTNYLDTLDLAFQFIEADAQGTPEGERSRTRYDIQWLSDGQPDPCQLPEPVIAATEQIMTLEETYGFFDMHLSTTRLFAAAPGSVAGCEAYNPDDYLAPMAEVGRGTYRTLTSDELDFDIAFSEIVRQFERRQFFLVNENRVSYGGELWADSDGDGLRDADTVSEPDPLAADANADGCGDRVDHALLPNVGLCGAFCAEDLQGGDPASLPDTDLDGLPDCVEQTLGYQRLSSDSDLDGFYDALELKMGTNALDAETLTRDGDLDGVSDAEEIRIGTNPGYPELDASLAYQYSPPVPIAATTPGTSCFSFAIDNVKLVQTLATPAAQEGNNRLCLYVVQTSVDNPSSEPTVTRACKAARYLYGPSGETKEPRDGILSFAREDFSVLLCPGSCD